MSCRVPFLLLGWTHWIKAFFKVAPKMNITRLHGLRHLPSACKQMERSGCQWPVPVTVLQKPLFLICPSHWGLYSCHNHWEQVSCFIPPNRRKECRGGERCLLFEDTQHLISNRYTKRVPPKLLVSAGLTALLSRRFWNPGTTKVTGPVWMWSFDEERGLKVVSAHVLEELMEQVRDRVGALLFVFC